MLQIMIGIVIMGILVTISIPDLRKMIWASKQTQAVQLQQDLNNWYALWSTNGGTHQTTAGDTGTMAQLMLNTMTSAATDSGTAKGSGSQWVDETKMKLAGKSMAGNTRTELKRPWAMDNGAPLVDSLYEVHFDTRSSADHGAFTVTLRE